jgi:hypothetical protein
MNAFMELASEVQAIYLAGLTEGFAAGQTGLDEQDRIAFCIGTVGVGTLLDEMLSNIEQNPALLDMEAGYMVQMVIAERCDTS